MIKVAVLDYGLGNVRSVSAAIEKTNCIALLTDKRDKILECDGLVIPGVGAFSHGMECLKKKGLDKTIHEFVNTAKPILGICLGMQLLMSKSYEFGVTNGLNIISGEVKKLTIPKESYEKLPNISWSSLSMTNQKNRKEILDLVNPEDSFYFIHSYAVQPNNPDHEVAKSAFAGAEFTSVIQQDRVIGCQFHPEKSGPAGLKIMKQFAKMSGGAHGR